MSGQRTASFLATAMRSLFIVLGGGLAACSAATEPIPDPEPEIWRVYSLTHLRGEPLPSYRGLVAGDSVWLVSETLRFQTNGFVAYEISYASEATPGAAPTLWGTGAMPYEVNGDWLQVGTQIMCFAMPCPATARVGTFTVDAMTISLGDTLEFRYARVPLP